MHKGLLAILLGLLGLLPVAAQAPKVPDDIQVRVLKIQKDQLAQQNRITQIQQAYQATQQAIVHDDEELRTIRTEALKAASLDAASWDLDVDKLEFVQKPKTPEVKK